VARDLYGMEADEVLDRSEVGAIAATLPSAALA
jgi:hypothetical protein